MKPQGPHRQRKHSSHRKLHRIFLQRSQHMPLPGSNAPPAPKQLTWRLVKVNGKGTLFRTVLFALQVQQVQLFSRSKVEA